MKIFFKENKNFLTDRNKIFLENKLLNDNFPFFFQSNSVSKNQRDYFMSHIVLQRLEHSEDHKKSINTDIETYNETIDILKNFCDSIKEKPYFFTRIAYNMTFNCGFDKCEPHQDHGYDHKQIIIYLNESPAKTIICDNKKIVKQITPKLGKGICFGNLPHYQEFPKLGVRLVLVATFI